MRYGLKWLTLVVLTAALVPLADNPDFLHGNGMLVPAAMAQSAEECKVEADRLLEQGIEQANVSQFREALQSWEQALAIYREIGDRQGEGSALGSLGIAYSSLGQYERAIDFFEQRLAIAREIGNREWEGISLDSLGNAYFSLGQYERAIDFFEQYLAISREIENR